MDEKQQNIYSLIPLAEKALKKFRNTPSFDEIYKSDYHRANYYVVQQALAKDCNIYIGTNSPDSPQNITLAILIPLVYNLLVASPSTFMPDLETLKSDYIFIREGISSYYEMYEGKHSLVSKIKEGHRLKHFDNFDEVFKIHFIADKKNYSDRKCHQALGCYKECYNLLTENCEQPPSFFQKKIILICNKSELFSQLNSLNLKHCIPFGSIVASDQDYIKETLPIESLVLVASDYELARAHMLEHRELGEYEYLIVSGDTKISKLKSLVKNDCNNGLFKNYCLIGNQAFSPDKSLLVWHWTKNEEYRLLDKYQIEIQMKGLQDCEELTDVCVEYYRLRDNLLDDYDSRDHFKQAHFLFFKILGDKLNMLDNIDEQLASCRMEITKSMLSDNYEKEDIEQSINQIIDQLRIIYDVKILSPTIWSALAGLGNEKVNLVVNNGDVDEWRKQLTIHDMSHINLISDKDFRREIGKGSAAKTYYFTQLPTYNLINRLQRQILDQEVWIKMLLYPPEISALSSRMKKIQRWERQNTGAKDMSLFPELELNRLGSSDTDDPIVKFEDRIYDVSDEMVPLATGYDSYDNYIIQVVTIKEPSIQNVSCSQKVLRKDGDDIALVSVTDLEMADFIMIYENKSRDYLYQLLSNTSQRFAQVERFSKLWKKRLREYLNIDNPESSDDNVIDNYSCYDTKLNNLAMHIGVSSEYIIKNWVSVDAKTRFPQKSKLEKLISFLLKQGLLNNTEAAEIRSSRSYFLGVMISLGHNLSAEAQMIILSQPADYDQFIIQYVCENTEEYPLLSKLDSQAIKSIIDHNFIKAVFIKLIEQGGQNEGE
ncbi:MAG: hypothetical protein WC944_03365 [Candidatus Cloacimonadaceae bacterium]|nr:hypothetical protein [Candidatus Cloacimonadota bacterium]MDD3663028.1 hypothetical protein [Candidatus Paceibacterota bacterium]